MKEQTAIKIIEKLQQNGFEAYLVGGCVRDKILNITPLDYDIATSATPQEIMPLFKKIIPVGIAFGVLKILQNNYDFEIATFRKDGLYSDNRRPDKVSFASAKEDVLRRDFTINGLLFDPIKNQLLDFVGGKKDLENKIIRCIGDPDIRFVEDKLRLLRAVRFAARFNYRIEDATYQAILKSAAQITSVSAERIREELIKIFIHPNRVLGLDLLDQTGLLEKILPEVSKMKGVNQPPEFHPEGDVYVHTKLALSLLENPSKELSFATLLHDIGKPSTITYEDRIRFNFHCEVGAQMADKLLRNLKFSNESRIKIVKYVKGHLRFKDVQKMRINKLKRFLREDTFQEELELHRVDCLACHQMLDNWYFCKEKLKEFGSTEELKLKLPINGNDLIQMGYKPGPLFQEILTKVEDALLENQIATKEEALQFVQDNFKQ